MSEDEKAFRDSKWIFITDISFIQPDDVIADLKFWLRNQAKLPEHNSQNDPSKLAETLLQKIQGRSIDALTKLSKIERRNNDLKSTVVSDIRREKRGLIDRGGKVLNWLFCIATNENKEK